MAGSLGSLYVELAANTAKFVGPLSEAAKAAKSAANSISREFGSLQRIASQTFGAFGQFNPVISQFSFAFAQAGRAASEAMGSFGKINTGLGAVGAIGAGATAALGAVAVGTLALAAHSAESAAKLYELSQSTGVSTEALSGLNFVATQMGVSTESMTRGLERMSRSAFQAAAAPIGAINAYTRLGISVKDSSGQMRSTESIFSDLAERFSAMADGPAKTALAIQLFGRSGAELIPVLNQGKTAINDWVSQARSMGIVISSDLAESSLHFQQTLGVLSGIAQGLANRVLVDLLNSLQTVASALASDFGKPNSTLQAWADGLAKLTKDFLALADTALFVARTMNATVNLAFNPLKIKEYISYVEEAYKKNKQFLGDLFAPQQGASGFDAGEAALRRMRRSTDLGLSGGAAPATITAKDTVAELVEKLKDQTKAELDLAAATGLSAAALVAQKAAGEADAKIAETRAELLDRERSLKEQLSEAKANQKGPEAARFEQEIAGVRKLLAELDSDVPAIKALYLELAAAQEATRIGGEMSKETLDFSRQIDSLGALVAAYKQGGAAIAAAGIEKQLEEDKQRVAELEEQFAHIASTDPFNHAALDKLQSSLNGANAMLVQHRSQLEQIRSLEIDASIAKDSAAFKAETAAVNELNAAYLKSRDAAEAAQVNVKVAQFKAENPGASEAQISAITELYRQQSEQAHATQTAEEAGQYELGRAYQDTLDKLNDIRQALISAGQPTILVDTAINQAGLDNIEAYRRATFEAQNQQLLGDAKLYDQQNELNAQWDEAANKVGTLQERYRAFLDEVQRQGANPLGNVFHTLEESVNGLSDAIARLAVTGRNSFRQLGQEMMQSLLRAQIQNTFSQLAGLAEGIRLPGRSNQTAAAGVPDFGSVLAGGPARPAASGLAGTFESAIGKAFGLGGKGIAGKGPSGAAGDPIYVAFAGMTGLPFTPGGFGTGTTPPFVQESGDESGLAKVFHLPQAQTKGSGGSLFADLEKIGGGAVSGIETAAKGIGGIFAKFFGLFGGFLAGGGDVTPGRAYMVGEKHPEFFIPHQSGTIATHLQQSGGSGSARHTEVHLHINGVNDADSFLRSSSQIVGHMQAQLAAVQSRNT